MMPIRITDEMRQAAERESRRRDAHILHHFELAYMSREERDAVGFLGEFACKECLGLDWKRGIRDNYETIDEGDILTAEYAIDIKTETIPGNILQRLVRDQVGDNAPYGRRLINQGQIRLLEHYDYVVWGAFPRETRGQWFPLGYLESAYILQHYSVTIDTPFGRKYNEPCLNVRQSELKRMDELARILHGR